VKHPLLLPKPGFATRTVFDAACRFAGVVPNVFFESSTPHAVLALAEAGHGMAAIVPSLLQTDRGGLQFWCVTHRQEPLRIAPAVLWDRRRAPRPHAERFAELLSAHIQAALPNALPNETGPLASSIAPFSAVSKVLPQIRGTYGDQGDWQCLAP